MTLIPGTPHEARWVRSDRRDALPTAALERVIQATLGRCHILEVEALTEGYRNSNFKIRLDNRQAPIVVRIYAHDVSLCQKELDLLSLIRETVPVPQVIAAHPQGLDGFPPFVAMDYIEGISFRALKQAGNKQAIAEAAFSAGETLAGIGRFTFSKSGWIAPGPTVTAPLLEGDDAGPRFVDLCLRSENLQGRVSAELRDRISHLMWTTAPQLSALETEHRLVHSDFGSRNLLLQPREGHWSLAAVLDWEFAVSGSPLADIGHFLRYERVSETVLEAHFSQAYTKAGGGLPDTWRRLARVVDLLALCESLTHDSLPDGVTSELVELVRATVDNRDPEIPQAPKTPSCDGQ